MVDVIVVGAGPAGLMAALSAAEELPNPQFKILLLDSKSSSGSKLLMSGGGRCNIGNRKVDAADFQGGPRHFMQHALEGFSSERTVDFFKGIGVDLVEEANGKYFPISQSSHTVLEALLKRARQLNVDMARGMRVVSAEKSGDEFILEVVTDKERRELRGKRLILATGGLSYPQTGSDGHGCKIASNFGHKIERQTPALTTLLTRDARWRALAGLSLEVELQFYSHDKKTAKSRGSFLFTHWGFSGPAVFDISRYYTQADKKECPQLRANFLPGLSREIFKERIEGEVRKAPKQFLKNYLAKEFSLPLRFVQALLKKIHLDGDAPIKNMSNRLINELAQGLYNYPLEISASEGFEKAEATAGGVSLNEIKASSMESKLVKGLFFAGEMMDVDGRVGGYNLQWAWTSGALAGRGAAKSLHV